MWIRRSSGIYFWNKPNAEKLEINGRAVGGILQKLYIGGDYYLAPAVYVKDGSGSWRLEKNITVDNQKLQKE